MYRQEITCDVRIKDKQWKVHFLLIVFILGREVIWLLISAFISFGNGVLGHVRKR